MRAEILLRIGILCSLFFTASLGDVHIRSSHVSCDGLDLRAETAMTHRLVPLPPHIEALSVPSNLASLDIPSSPILLLT